MTNKKGFPLRFEVNMVIVRNVLYILGVLFAGYVWLSTYHEKYVVKVEQEKYEKAMDAEHHRIQMESQGEFLKLQNNANLIYIDLQVQALKFQIKLYDDSGTSLNDVQKRVYLSNSNRLNELQKSRNELIGNGH